MKPVALIGVVVLALATATATASTAKTTESPNAHASAYVSLYNQIAGIVASDKGNCVKMAGDLKSWGTSHKSEIDSLSAEGPKLSKMSLLTIGLSIASQIATDAQKIATNALACATNAQVRAALAAQRKLTKP